MDLSSSASGTVFITGQTQAADRLPKTVQRRPDIPKESQATTGTKALVTKVVAAGQSDPHKQQDLTANTTQISLKVLATGKDTTFTVTPKAPDATAAAGTTPSPVLGAPTQSSARAGAALAAPMAANSIVENERYCAVARNDPAKQVMQPKPRQVEWAVDQAVNGTLNQHVSRPATGRTWGCPPISRRPCFPASASTAEAAYRHRFCWASLPRSPTCGRLPVWSYPVSPGNPLIGNYYGIKYAADGQQNDPWGINWADADCGYGITQITDGMRMHGREKPGTVATLSTLQQEAAALDYTANVAAGQRVLADKWNVTNQDGLIVNNGDPKYLENWFFALWAYNSGYYPKAAAGNNGGLWGVGFTKTRPTRCGRPIEPPFLKDRYPAPTTIRTPSTPRTGPTRKRSSGGQPAPPGIGVPGHNGRRLPTRLVEQRRTEVQSQASRESVLHRREQL
ncbi:hypothetical protein ACFVT6_40635 [Streptomyces sp. NPDC058049]|uniref:hypothetical protein n=1 Tax=Streptomyces sp. NPDC058049 TaxID=3346314 RepID=UPI0036E1975D